jgi:hypothetical protein
LTGGSGQLAEGESGGFALAAQRNYLQSLHAAVAGQGVYVGGLYIGAAIKHTPFYERRAADRAAGTSVPDMPEVDPDDLADLLWTMHSTKSQPEATYRPHRLDPRCDRHRHPPGQRSP